MKKEGTVNIAVTENEDGAGCNAQIEFSGSKSVVIKALPSILVNLFSEDNEKPDDFVEFVAMFCSMVTVLANKKYFEREETNA